MVKDENKIGVVKSEVEVERQETIAAQSNIIYRHVNARQKSSHEGHGEVEIKKPNDIAKYYIDALKDGPREHVFALKDHHFESAIWLLCANGCMTMPELITQINEVFGINISIGDTSKLKLELSEFEKFIEVVDVDNEIIFGLNDFAKELKPCEILQQSGKGFIMNELSGKVEKRFKDSVLRVMYEIKDPFKVSEIHRKMQMLGYTNSTKNKVSAVVGNWFKHPKMSDLFVKMKGVGRGFKYAKTKLCKEFETFQQIKIYILTGKEVEVVEDPVLERKFMAVVLENLKSSARIGRRIIHEKLRDVDVFVSRQVVEDSLRAIYDAKMLTNLKRIVSGRYSTYYIPTDDRVLDIKDWFGSEDIYNKFLNFQPGASIKDVPAPVEVKADLDSDTSDALVSDTDSLTVDPHNELPQPPISDEMLEEEVADSEIKGKETSIKLDNASVYQVCKILKTLASSGMKVNINITLNED